MLSRTMFAFNLDIHPRGLGAVQQGRPSGTALGDLLPPVQIVFTLSFKHNNKRNKHWQSWMRFKIHERKKQRHGIH